MLDNFKFSMVVNSGPLKGRKYSIDEPMLCIVGREFDCNLRIESSSVSRHHCIIEVKPPHVFLKDLGSTNGSFINEQQTPEFEDSKEIYSGDTLRLGDNSIAITIEPHIQRPTTSTKVITQQNKALAQTVPIHGYSICKELGRGGAGVVYLAEHETTKVQRAIKVMLPNVKVSPVESEMFFREIDLTKDLNHPNIVQMTDSGYSNDIFYFALEFCNSGTVADLTNKGRTQIPLEQAVDLTMQVLDGLDYAHNFHVQAIKLKDGSERSSKGIVHRDIKPENILINNEDGKLVAKIADFGLSKAFKQAGFTMGTMTGAFCGTPGFVPRQQLLNYKYAKPEVDVWGVAATLYFMLTGIPPRGDDYGQNPLRMILETDPIPIHTVDTSIPQPIAELLDKALADKNNLAFKSASDFKDALNKAMMRLTS